MRPKDTKALPQSQGNTQPQPIPMIQAHVRCFRKLIDGKISRGSLFMPKERGKRGSTSGVQRRRLDVLSEISTESQPADEWAWYLHFECDRALISSGNEKRGFLRCGWLTSEGWVDQSANDATRAMARFAHSKKPTSKDS